MTEVLPIRAKGAAGALSTRLVKRADVKGNSTVKLILEQGYLGGLSGAPLPYSPRLPKCTVVYVTSAKSSHGYGHSWKFTFNTPPCTEGHLKSLAYS